MIVNVPRTWIIGSKFEGIGAYDAVTNPTGIVQGYDEFGTPIGNYNFGDNLAGAGVDVDANGKVAAERFAHWRVMNYYAQMGTAIDLGPDYGGVIASLDVFENIVGQHGLYWSGTYSNVSSG